MAYGTLRKGRKKMVYPTLASVHSVFLVARALKDASAVTVFLRKPRAACNIACLRQAACTGVFYNTFASRMPANKGAFKVSPARVIAQSGHVLPNVGPRRFACGREGRTVVVHGMHYGSSGAKEEKYWYHCWLVDVERVGVLIGRGSCIK